jgi:hypothetical protein
LNSKSGIERASATKDADPRFAALVWRKSADRH